MKFFIITFLLFVIFSCSDYQQISKLNYSFLQDTLSHNQLSVKSRFYGDTLIGLICNESNTEMRFKETEIIVTELELEFNHDKQISNKFFPKIIYPNTCASVYTSINSNIKLIHNIDSLQKIKDTVLVFSSVIDDKLRSWKTIKRNLYLPVYFGNDFEIIKINYFIDTLHIQRQIINNEKFFCASIKDVNF